MTASTDLRRTALYDEHVKLAGRLVPYAGFEMPVQYAGILKEHEAVRKRAGLFDLSHMGQFLLHGPSVAEWAETLTINAVASMKPLQARYNIFCNPRGGAHDDTIFYRLDDRWLLVVNGANADKMWDHLQANRADDVRLESLHGRNALIAIQGPKALAMLQAHTDVDLAGVKYYFCAEGNVYGRPAILARTGYTGEDGFEIFVHGDHAPEIWSALLRDHAADGLEACGLGARDVLRLEAGMPLYGHELDETTTPIEAGLGFFVALEKGEFNGRTVLARQKAEGLSKKLVAFTMTGKSAPPRPLYPIWSAGDSGNKIGQVASGTQSPSLGKGIGMAYVPPEFSKRDTLLEIEIRGRRCPALVAPKPFYRRPGA